MFGQHHPSVRFFFTTSSIIHIRCRRCRHDTNLRCWAGSEEFTLLETLDLSCKFIHPIQAGAHLPCSLPVQPWCKHRKRSWPSEVVPDDPWMRTNACDAISRAFFTRIHAIAQLYTDSRNTEAAAARALTPVAIRRLKQTVARSFNTTVCRETQFPALTNVRTVCHLGHADRTTRHTHTTSHVIRDTNDLYILNLALGSWDSKNWRRGIGHDQPPGILLKEASIWNFNYTT